MEAVKLLEEGDLERNLEMDQSPSRYTIKLIAPRCKPIIFECDATATMEFLTLRIEQEFPNIPSICSNARIFSDCIIITQGDWPRKPFPKVTTDLERKITLRTLDFPTSILLFLQHRNHTGERLAHTRGEDPVLQPLPVIFPGLPPILRDLDDVPAIPDEAMLTSDDENDVETNEPEAEESLSYNVLGGVENPENARQAMREAFLNRYIGGNTSLPMEEMEFGNTSMSLQSRERTAASSNVCTLSELCLNYVAQKVILVSRIMQNSHVSPLDIISDGSAQASRRDLELVHDIVRFVWPTDLAMRLISILKDSLAFTCRVSMMLKNFVDRLDLDFYPMLTTDLLKSLTRFWPDLCILKMNGLGDGQLGSNAIELLGKLSNLEEIYLNGVRAVNDSNVNCILDLPRLQRLDLGQTRISDRGWLNYPLGHGCCATLNHLVVTGMTHTSNNNTGIEPIVSKAITDVGFLYILRLFPNLVNLDVSKTGVKCCHTDCDDLRKHVLTHLSLFNCDQLVQLPFWLENLQTIKINSINSLSPISLIPQLRNRTMALKSIEGLFSLNGFNKDSFLALMNEQLALTEYNFSTCRLDWFNLEILLEGLRLLSSNARSRKAVQRVCLPIKAYFVHPSTANEFKAAEIVNLLSDLKQLTYLHLGEQTCWIPHYLLEAMLRQLCHLKSLSLYSISERDLDKVKSWLPFGCKVHVAIHV